MTLKLNHLHKSLTGCFIQRNWDVWDTCGGQGEAVCGQDFHPDRMGPAQERFPEPGNPGIQPVTYSGAEVRAPEELNQ